MLARRGAQVRSTTTPTVPRGIVRAMGGLPRPVVWSVVVLAGAALAASVASASSVDATEPTAGDDHDAHDAEAVASSRLAGADRFETAASISRAAFPDDADAVYLARADDFADALAAGVVDAGPVLLASDDAPLPASVADAIAALDPDEVVGLGGRSALPREILLLAAEGRDVDRLDGRDRFDTAARVADEAAATTAGGDVSRLYLARADAFPDALAAGALADGPLLLVPPEGPVTPTVLESARLHAPDELVALGSDAAIADDVVAEVADAAGQRAALHADDEWLRGTFEPFSEDAPRLVDHLTAREGQRVRLDVALRVDAGAATRPFDGEPLVGTTVISLDGASEGCEPDEAGCAVDLAIAGVDDATTSLERHATSWRLRGAFEVGTVDASSPGNQRITLVASGSVPSAQPERVRRVGEAFADALRQGDRDAGVAEEHRRLRGSVWDRDRELAEQFGGPDAYLVDPDCGSWGGALFAATHGGVSIEPRQGRPRVIGSPGEEANFVEISPDPPVPACVTDPRGAPVRDTPGGVEMGRAGFGECSLKVVPGEDGLTTGADGELWRSARWGVHLGVVPDAAVRRR